MKILSAKTFEAINYYIPHTVMNRQISDIKTGTKFAK